MKSLLIRLKQKKVYISIIVVISFMFGYLFHGGHDTSLHDDSKSVDIHAAHSKDKKSEIWTCSMHPNIRLPGPGKCPLCGMTLIPVDTNSKDKEPNRSEYSMSEAAKKLAKITTEPVSHKFVNARVRMVGKIDFDETRVGYITAWVPGRIDDLYVDYTGVPVKKGDHMVSLYSPELVGAQEELIQAVKSVKKAKINNNKFMQQTTKATLDATREKLRLWGLTKKQIKDIEKKGKPTDHITVYSPMSGIVIHKDALEGMYITTGTKIYTIADLSNLWVKLDAYESDLTWLRYGQKVEFTTEAYPGETFHGRISFIDPVLNAKTRTVKIRVNVSNADGRLKPEMFVRAVVHANVATKGQVMDPELAGKWICPMHPEVVKEGSGSCQICGMDLIRTESLGFVSAETNAVAPLVVPASAVLITGERSIVYVEVPGRKRPTYEGREIVIGPRTGDYYIVKSGLLDGERVVTNGNFKIDSSLQIQAKPSMMYPDGGAPATGHEHHGGAKPKKNVNDNTHDAHKGHNHGTQSLVLPEPELNSIFKKIPKGFKQQISAVIPDYLNLQEALSKDDMKKGLDFAKKMEESLSKVKMKLLTGQAHMDWMKTGKIMKESLKMALSTKDIKKLRIQFVEISREFAGALSRFGFIGNSTLYKLKCPMAFNGKGVMWIQKGKETKNPYLGSAMPGCGEQIGKIKGDATHE